MSLFDTITRQLGGNAAEQMASALGADKNSTGKAIGAALPLLLAALARNSQNAEGAQSLSNALDKDHDGSILTNVTGYLAGGDASPGQAILKHVFGGSQARVETGISKASGLSGESAAKILAMLAPLVMGALGKAKREQQIDAGGLAGMLNQERRGIEKTSPGAMGVLNALLDADGDGDVDMADITKRGSGLLGRLFKR